MVYDFQVSKISTYREVIEMKAVASDSKAEAIWLSLIIPTRGRAHAAVKLWKRLSELAERPSGIEVIWVIDSDDSESQSVLGSAGAQSDKAASAAIQLVQVPSGLSMGKLNCEGAVKARGDWLMLLNDDVMPKTRHWDRALRETAASLSDAFHLLMVNDLDFEHRLSTFPIVSKAYVRAVGGICPEAFLRFRIDDHIYTTFRALGFMSERLRIHFHPYVIFQHANWGLSGARRLDFLERDDQTFRALDQARISACRQILSEIGNPTPLVPVPGQFSVTRPGHRREVLWSAKGLSLATAALALWSRVYGLCVRQLRLSKRV